MEKQTLYDFLRELVDDGKGDIIYDLFSLNIDMVICRMSARSMLDRIVYDTFRNYIILDCDVVINDTKR